MVIFTLFRKLHWWYTGQDWYGKEFLTGILFWPLLFICMLTQHLSNSNEDAIMMGYLGLWLVWIFVLINKSGNEWARMWHEVYPTIYKPLYDENVLHGYRGTYEEWYKNFDGGVGPMNAANDLYWANNGKMKLLP